MKKMSEIRKKDFTDVDSFNSDECSLTSESDEIIEKESLV